MLTFSIDLDTDLTDKQSRGIQLEKTVEVGSIFQIVLMVEDDGIGESPVTFDSLYLEVLFNDNSPVLHVDRGQRPVTGELAAKCESVVVDAFNHKPIGGGTLSDKKGPFSQGTPLTLRLPACETQIGPYTDSTGQAGIRSLQSPFRISPGEPPEFFAMGKVGAGLEALTGGESSIIAIGHAFLGGKPLPTNSGVGKITVVG